MKNIIENSINMEEIPFGSLAKYSSLPDELIFSKKSFRKSQREVIREFQVDKWGRLLAYYNENREILLDDLENFILPKRTIIPCFIDGKFYLSSAKNLEKLHINLYSSVLSQYIEGASALVELGAGFGSKILKISKISKFESSELIAGEFTKAGCQLINIIAKKMGKEIKTGYCDFSKLTLDNLNIPPNSIIFTSYAVHYVPKLSADFPGFFHKFKPKAVIHFEPCYEVHSKSSIHELLCRKYIERNDYTKNLLAVLKKGKKKFNYSLKIKKNVIGTNPFLPISVLECIPKNDNL